VKLQIGLNNWKFKLILYCLPFNDQSAMVSINYVIAKK